MSTISYGSVKNEVLDSNKLLNQLLECVQQCQKRYGGKTQLATEFDNCVVTLCITLEAIFLHGLRTKPQENTSNISISTLKQVSDIVTNTLNFNNENPSFWLFVKKHLTKHEQDRYSVLKQIWTDTGRGRAWIRSTLNERSLERYLHTVLSSTVLLKNYYEDWAFLRDEEKNSMLPNMAAGLGSILFAISIDKPELNSGNSSLLKAEKTKTRPEPIIEAPIKGIKKDAKKKRKVAKQIILFDEDDEDGRESTSSSVPSITSSGSVVSDTFSTQDSFNKSLNPKETIQEAVMDTSDSNTEEPQMRRKLSIENSGSRDRYAMYLEGPLTPLPHDQSHIGELTPISVDVEEPGDSLETVEAPSDICAVLTAVETKNKEQLEKLHEKIDLLTRENENLNEQLRKYMGAVQMLKRDDTNLQLALQGLQLETNIPDYKTEAKLYEQKLVQVAEMHAELMDFNIVLQQTLCQKETVVERLNHELEELRGPVINTNADNESNGNVNVWIPSAFLTGTGSDSHHVYQVFLRAGSDEWNIYRRYAQFHALHSDLKKLDPSLSNFDFPPKKSIGNKESSLVDKRRKKLQIYLRRVLRHWPELSQCSSRYLLEQHLTFFKDQKVTKKENKRSMFPSRQNGGNSSSSDNHYTGL